MVLAEQATTTGAVQYSFQAARDAQSGTSIHEPKSDGTALADFCFLQLLLTKQPKLLAAQSKLVQNAQCQDAGYADYASLVIAKTCFTELSL